jgi:hypothetical protein
MPAPEAAPVHRVLQATPVSTAELALMRRIDKLHLDHPFAGARMLRDLLTIKSSISIHIPGMVGFSATPLICIHPEMTSTFPLVICLRDPDHVLPH